MSRTSIFLVSEDKESIEKAKQYWLTQGVVVHVYTPSQWRDGLENSFFRSQLSLGLPALSIGLAPVNDSLPSNVVPFPGTRPADTGLQVSTMDEIECKAIEGAIFQFRGNLTEAAKALGIGRATLYRKVKQFQIDPNAARRKRAA